jgi:hypothetical protein
MAARVRQVPGHVSTLTTVEHNGTSRPTIGTAPKGRFGVSISLDKEGNMTMQTHRDSPLGRVSYSSESRGAFGPDTARTHLAVIKRFCVSVLTILLAGGLLAAIMALKVAIYLPRVVHN